ncbi:MAG: THxN family PEP-CTERM protein [Burkholderiales bacterium]|nr:THxN family PEP-CTERM protein [Burkholderiales bacterium]
MKTWKKLLAGAGLGLALSAGAQAAIVTDWTYTLVSQWTAYAPGGVSNPNPLTLQWGTSTGFGQSSLVITNPSASNSVGTYIGGGSPPATYIAPGSAITHTNRPITGTSLTSATLTATLNLQATTPPVGGPGALPSLQYNIRFVETSNSAPCADPTSPTPCNDIFIQLTGLLNQSFTFDSDGAGPDDPVTYFVNVFPISGGVLNAYGLGDPNKPAAVCTAASVAAPCIGFTTPENAATTLQFGFTISTERLSVPEPGSIALIGAALLGAGFWRRRRSLEV